MRVHDLVTDEEITDQSDRCPAEAVVLFDATFVQRGSLREHWDVVVLPRR